MARSTLSTVKRMVYENLAVSTGTYGTLDTTNKRYLSGYIDDAVIRADITVIDILIKAKQEILLRDLYTTVDIMASKEVIVNNWTIVKVECFTASTTPFRAVEMDWDTFKLVNEGSLFGSYTGYYAIKDGQLYVIPKDTHSGSGAIAKITYIDLTHPSTLSTLLSPTGFESVVADLATARLLMKRLDKPQESQFYTQQAYQFLQEYGAKQMPMSEVVDR